jgi:hypothetical protein
VRHCTKGTAIGERESLVELLTEPVPGGLSFDVTQVPDRRV